jgi:polyisoprenoid-binding protein YceI
MTMAKFVLAVAALLTTATITAAGETYRIVTNGSEVSFQVRHITGPVRGTFTDFSGTLDLDAVHPERSSIQFRIKAASVDTGNEKRDAHLRTADFFDVAAHPEIVFTSTKIVAVTAATFAVSGWLSIRGVTRDVVLPVTRVGEGDQADAVFTTVTTLNRKDYSITWNRALDTGGWVLADEVEVSITLRTVPDARQGTKE